MLRGGDVAVPFLALLLPSLLDITADICPHTQRVYLYISIFNPVLAPAVWSDSPKAMLPIRFQTPSPPEPDFRSPCRPLWHDNGVTGILLFLFSLRRLSEARLSWPAARRGQQHPRRRARPLPWCSSGSSGTPPSGCVSSCAAGTAACAPPVGHVSVTLTQRWKGGPSLTAMSCSCS